MRCCSRHLELLLQRLRDADAVVRRLCAEIVSTLRSPGADIGGALLLSPEQLADVDVALQDSHYRCGCPQAPLSTESAASFARVPCIYHSDAMCEAVQ